MARTSHFGFCQAYASQAYNLKAISEPDQFEQSIGVKDLMEALEEDRELVLTAEHARHVVEILSNYKIAAREGRTVSLETTF